MTTCAICREAIDGPALEDAASGHRYHAPCAIARAPGDALGLLLGVAATVLTPIVVVWAA
jgi:hypothetical protein